jgi:outer membrane protein assembly factor BamE (lipoprotein component of BamABCDE complex)
MYLINKLLFIAITINLIISCSEKVLYSGIIYNENIDYLSFVNKDEIIESLGKPKFIDPIEKKYYYFSEKKIVKSSFNEKIQERHIFIYQINELGNVELAKKYDLSDGKNISFIQEQTKNELIKRGLLEEIFGGVGKQKLPTTVE